MLLRFYRTIQRGYRLLYKGSVGVNFQRTGTVFFLCVLIGNFGVSFPVSADINPYLRTEIERVQTHLLTVEELLRHVPRPGLSEVQRENRNRALDELRAYAESGIFPQNYSAKRRLSIFKDAQGVWCAVGYLLVQTGYASLAETLAESDNFVYLDALPDFESTPLGDWARLFGFRQSELSLIQPQYHMMKDNPFGKTGLDIGAATAMCRRLQKTSAVLAKSASFVL